MPLQKLQFRPGVNREGTSLSNEGGWYECDKVRFRSGYPEKIGGWSLWNGSTNKFLGVCRSLWNWVTLKGFNVVGLGTNLKFYLGNGGTYYDITPIRLTTTGTTTFSTVINTNTVTVVDTGASSLQIGDYVTFSLAATVGGLDLNNEYVIQTIISGISYTITAVTNASSTVNGGGGASTVAKYQVSSGAATAEQGTGWGTGPWPEFKVTTLTNPFATVNTSTTITVTQTAHGLTTGNFVFFASITDTDINGISNKVLQKAFQITYVDANSYTISTVIGTLSYPATSTGSSQGGTVVVYTPSGTARGWGEAFSGNVGFTTQLRLWSQSNFGENLLFNPRGGALYYWAAGSASQPNFTTRGTLVSGTNVPASINQIMVSDASRIVIAFGCNDYGAYDPTAVLDPLLIRWTAQESYTDWTISATNQAGNYRLSHGSQIIGALQTRQEIIVWTDAAVYGMQYLGPPYIWGFTLLADNTSIVSPNAMATASGVTYWMGTDKFYVYSGRVETLPCSLRSYVFDDINRGQQLQFFAGTNEGYSEVWWFYCSRNSNVIDRYVIFNYLDRVWYYGTMGRTSWLDSPVQDYPIATTLDNVIVQHESAVDDGTTNPPTAINAYVQSSDFDIEDGHNYGFIWRIIPDITFDGSVSANGTVNFPKVTYTLRPRQNPGAPYNTAPTPTVQSNNAGYTNIVQTYNVQQFTEIVYTRVRGRQMSFRVESNSVGTQWQLGVPRIDIRPDGRRA
jgi:hypothetical protein